MVSYTKKQEEQVDEIIDEESLNYSNSSSGLTPRDIILSHIKKLSSFIFSGSIDTKKDGDKGLSIQKVDKREIIIQAIDFTIAILQPFYDEDMVNKQEDYNNKLNKLKDKLREDSIIFSAYNKCSEDSNFDNKKLVEWINFFECQNLIMIDKEESYYEEFIIEKFELSMKLFQDMNFLLHRKNYLQDEEYSE